ncbi:MAG: heparinase II/III family protein, partial [Bryobacteraceae bacterium]
MRSAEEIRFRLKQAAANVWLAIARPATSAKAPAPLPGLPDPRAVVEKLRGSTFAFEIERLAGEFLQHRFAVLGYAIDAGPEIAWGRDYIHKKQAPKRYFPRIPYLDFDRAGDHKIIWELNRHQHLIVLAQAWRLTGRREFVEEIQRQLRGWLDDNPFQRSINWTSALEVAFRSLSWIWVHHLAGDEFASQFRAQFLTALYRHGLHLEYNLSVYFSPNTHLLGEAVALHAIGKLFPNFPRAEKWLNLGSRIVEEQMERQVREDGSHFEQSGYYHVYALDMFLFHAVVAGDASAAYRARVRKMAAYLAALAGPAGRLPLLGDDDGGRFFHPYG